MMAPFQTTRQTLAAALQNFAQAEISLGRLYYDYEPANTLGEQVFCTLSIHQTLCETASSCGMWHIVSQLNATTPLAV